MKTCPCRIPPKTQIPRLAPATPTGIDTVQAVRNSFATFKLLFILCITAVTTAAFADDLTFTNVNGANIGLTASWTNLAGANAVPNGNNNDNVIWSGVTPGNLLLNFDSPGAWLNTGFGSFGINLVCTANQLGNVQITCAGAASPAAGILNVTNNSPSGALQIGQPGNAHQLMFATRPGGSGDVGTNHFWINNSSSAATMDSSVTWVAGGGNRCVIHFGGTGNWIVNHNLRQNNNAAGPLCMTWDGPGSMTWSNGGTFNGGDNLGPVLINGGTVVMKGAGILLNFPAGNQSVAFDNSITNNGALLKFDSGLSDTIARYINGTGTLQVASGKLTLTANNSDYTGNTVLSGGELVAGGVEGATSGPLGVTNTISFTGGSLGYSLANTFDYSPRFSQAAGQSYSINTEGQNVLLTNSLTSSGGTFTKLGSGTLTLAGASTFSGLTAIGAGKLVLQGTIASTSVIVSNSTSLGVTNGSQLAPATLTVGTSSGATLEFNGVTSPTTPQIAAGTISAGGPITINVNGGTFNSIGQSFPLISWSSGSPPPVTLGTLIGAGGNLSTNGNQIKLNITSLAFIWTGLNNGNWDTNGTANNWKVNGAATIWQNGGTALFDDTATGTTNVTLASIVIPAGSTVNSGVKPYSATSSASQFIAGSGGLTKAGSTTLSLSGGVNTYSGPTTISGGTVSVGTLANGGSPSDIGASGSGAANLILNGGGLQYLNGGAQDSDRLFTVGTAGGTIDASGGGALNLNNSSAVALSGTGARVLTLSGSLVDNNTLAASLGDNGGATALVKNGPGTWVLTGVSTYSGATTIANGTLQIGTGGVSSIGAGNITDNGALGFNISSTNTVGTITGTGTLTKDGTGMLIMPGNNNYGATTVNNGILQVGTGGATGQLAATPAIANNGLIIFNSTGDLTLNGAISGTGNIIKRGSGLLKLLGANTYTGTTTVEPGARLQLCQGANGANASSVITNNGTVFCMRQDNNIFIYAGNIHGTGVFREEVSNGNGGDSTLTGTNDYTGGTYILGGGLILGDNGFTAYGGSIVGDVYLTNDYIHSTFGPFISAILTFNRAEDIVFPGNIVGDGQVIQLGNGTTALTGNNTWTNGTTVTAGTLQIGNGGTTGSIGAGAVTDNSNLAFNRSDDLTFGNALSGGGNLLKRGAGKVTLPIDTTYVGTTTVSNGTLVINGNNLAFTTYVAGGTLGGTGTLNGVVTLDPGTTLAPGASVGTLTINSDLNLGGNLAIEVNKSLAPSNDLVVVSGLLTNSGSGTLTVANLGPALQAGDKFTVFSQALQNGGALTVTGGGATWTNSLAADGSIKVLSVTTQPALGFVNTGNNLQFTWTGSFKLQAKTNNLLGAWTDYPGGGTSGVSVPIDRTKVDVFFRLVSQ